MIKTTSLLTAVLLLAGCAGGGQINTSRSQQQLNDLQDRAQHSADRGFYDNAGKLLQEALRLTSSLDDRQGQAAVLLQQARLARQQGKLAEAGQALTRALPLAAKSRLYADAAQEKALQELAAGRIDEAIQWARTAQQQEQGNLQARRLNLLARLTLLQKDHQQAGQLAEQALRHASAESLMAERANALRILGTVRGKQQRLTEGEQHLQQALQLDKQLELPLRIADDLEALAELARLRGDLQSQQEYSQRAQTVRANILQARQPDNNQQ